MKRIRNGILIFIVLLVLSGLTAFPIESGMESLSGLASLLPSAGRAWYSEVLEAVRYNNSVYPFMAYGTDWLAFAHIVIAVFIWGAYRDPVQNEWVVKAALISCFLVIPLALLAGEVRGIPWWWRLIDCSFGVFGALLLWRVLSWINAFRYAQDH